jgi:hypothetical protein
MNALVEGLVTIAGLVVGLGMVSVLVSKNANTTGVIQASASGLGSVIGVAQSPVTGADISFNLGYPSNNSFGG